MTLHLRVCRGPVAILCSQLALLETVLDQMFA
jgi:hypothetical protein